MTVSEAANQNMTFGDALTVATRTTDLFSELGSPRVVIQFAFANLPENPQLLLMSQETLVELASMNGSVPEEIDDNLVADNRPIFESLVQGLCLAIGNMLNEAVVTSGVSMRFQIVSLPPNLQRSDEVLRSSINLSSESVNGTVLWIMDNETAHLVLGVPLLEDDHSLASANPFESHGSQSKGAASPLDQSLEILMDIPLEISVELGRVKMLVKDVVELGSGSIVEIDKAAGEPVDVMVNGRLVARGEVVVIEDNFGVRITEILSPSERLMRLSEAA
ncbi:MAG TPA: flagellar motor switch protein FliN [Fimbriimonadaceae bacterium]|nr:flagellar motor switch protein FliN [Fimbriimonadaceae bacterium]HRJ32005.1 flagellar motor switch protein FliN [Fimbriimonadaceae bacterium]